MAVKKNWQLDASEEVSRPADFALTNGVPAETYVSTLFTRDDTSTEIEIDGLLKNAELEKSVKVCAQKYGGTQIKQDENGNFYYEVEVED